MSEEEKLAGDTPATPTPAPTPSVSPPNTQQVNVLLAFLQNLLNSGGIRQDFDFKTPQFWTMLGSVAAIIVAWINPTGDLSTPVQTGITVLGGIIVALFTHHAAAKVPVSKVQKMLSDATPERGFVAGSWSPTPLVASPPGLVTVGYYAPGTHHGSALAPGAVTPVAPPSGGTAGHGGTTAGFTTEGNVSGNVVIPSVTVHFSDPNHVTYAPLSPTAPLPNQSGNNSNEGVGGPSIPLRSGGLGVGGSVSAPGAYVPPAASAPNPDEANPSVFVAKETPPPES